VTSHGNFAVVCRASIVLHSGERKASRIWRAREPYRPNCAHSAGGKKPLGSSVRMRSSLASSASVTRICCRYSNVPCRGASRSTNRDSRFCAHVISRPLTPGRSSPESGRSRRSNKRGDDGSRRSLEGRQSAISRSPRCRRRCQPCGWSRPARRKALGGAGEFRKLEAERRRLAK